jgi:hypothetical protein
MAQRKPDQDLRIAARSAANNAQRDGRLHPSPCEICGEPNAQKHHEDYNQPLVVRWICHRCHVALHVLRGDLKARVNSNDSVLIDTDAGAAA